MLDKNVLNLTSDVRFNTFFVVCGIDEFDFSKKIAYDNSHVKKVYI